MRILPKGSTGASVRWRIVPGDGESIDRQKVLRTFMSMSCGRSIEIADLLNGSFDLIFPEGIDETVRANLYSELSTKCAYPEGTRPCVCS